jgi:hypothetical protein
MHCPKLKTKPTPILQVLMPVGSLPVDVVHERLMEARRTYKLNLGCALESPFFQLL